MSSNKKKETKKRLNHEREDGDPSPDFFTEQGPTRRAKLDSDSNVIKNTPSFGIDRNNSTS